jgi:hypothetical protein
VVEKIYEEPVEDYDIAFKEDLLKVALTVSVASMLLPCKVV